MSINRKKLIREINAIKNLADMEEFLEKNKEIINETPDFKLHVGHNMKRLKDLNRAIEFYSEHYDFSRDTSGLWFRGMLHQKMGNIENAIFDYEAIRNFDENSKYTEFLLLFLAKCHTVKGDFSVASLYLHKLNRIIGDGFQDFEAYCGGKISTFDLLEEIRIHDAKH